MLVLRNLKEKYVEITDRILSEEELEGLSLSIELIPCDDSGDSIGTALGYRTDLNEAVYIDTEITTKTNRLVIKEVKAFDTLLEMLASLPQFSELETLHFSGLFFDRQEQLTAIRNFLQKDSVEEIVFENCQFSDELTACIPVLTKEFNSVQSKLKNSILTYGFTDGRDQSTVDPAVLQLVTLFNSLCLLNPTKRVIDYIAQKVPPLQTNVLGLMFTVSDAISDEDHARAISEVITELRKSALFKKAQHFRLVAPAKLIEKIGYLLSLLKSNFSYSKENFIVLNERGVAADIIEILPPETSQEKELLIMPQVADGIKQFKLAPEGVEGDEYKSPAEAVALLTDEVSNEKVILSDSERKGCFGALLGAITAKNKVVSIDVLELQGVSFDAALVGMWQNAIPFLSGIKRITLTDCVFPKDLESAKQVGDIISRFSSSSDSEDFVLEISGNDYPDDLNLSGPKKLQTVELRISSEEADEIIGCENISALNCQRLVVHCTNHSGIAIANQLIKELFSTETKVNINLIVLKLPEGDSSFDDLQRHVLAVHAGYAGIELYVAQGGNAEIPLIDPLKELWPYLLNEGDDSSIKPVLCGLYQELDAFDLAALQQHSFQGNEAPRIWFDNKTRKLKLSPDFLDRIKRGLSASEFTQTCAESEFDVSFMRNPEFLLKSLLTAIAIELHYITGENSVELGKRLDKITLRDCFIDKESGGLFEFFYYFILTYEFDEAVPVQQTENLDNLIQLFGRLVNDSLVEGGGVDHYFMLLRMCKRLDKIYRVKGMNQGQEWENYFYYKVSNACQEKSTLDVLLKNPIAKTQLHVSYQDEGYYQINFNEITKGFEPKSTDEAFTDYMINFDPRSRHALGEEGYYEWCFDGVKKEFSAIACDFLQQLLLMPNDQSKQVVLTFKSSIITAELFNQITRYVTIASRSDVDIALSFDQVTFDVAQDEFRFVFPDKMKVVSCNLNQLTFTSQDYRQSFFSAIASLPVLMLGKVEFDDIKTTLFDKGSRCCFCQLDLTMYTPDESKQLLQQLCSLLTKKPIQLKQIIFTMNQEVSQESFVVLKTALEAKGVNVSLVDKEGLPFKFKKAKLLKRKISGGVSSSEKGQTVASMQEEGSNLDKEDSKSKRSRGGPEFFPKTKDNEGSNAAKDMEGDYLALLAAL